MTEREWLACTDPDQLMQFLGISMIPRKSRLFDTACCRNVWHLLSEEGRRAVEELERFVDGRASEKELDAAVESQVDFSDAGDISQYSAADLTAIAANRAGKDGDVAYDLERAWQCHLLRDILGNPFRPVSIDPSWLTWNEFTVFALARSIYHERAFDRLPSLADALEESGCIDADILTHCRQPGPHVRGCWIVDMLLGKGNAVTETEWLNCTDPEKMLEFLQGKAGERKQRLFACACCRQIWERLTHPLSRSAVESTELFADGQISLDELAEARRQHWDCNLHRTQRNAANAVSSAAFVMSFHRRFGSSIKSAHDAAIYAAKAASDAPDGDNRSYHDPDGFPLWQAARTIQVTLLHDIFGNPFRPVTINPAWLIWNDRTAQKIAQAIYDDRAFDRMPILADALEEAGCTNADILNHCRQPGEHVRGCWVVDILLGKE